MAGFGGWGHGGGGGGWGGPGGPGGGGGGGLRRSVDGWSDDALGKAYDHKVVARLAGYARPYKWRLLIAVLGTVIFSAASYTQPWLVGQATNSALAGNMSNLTRTSLAMLARALISWGS